MCLYMACVLCFFKHKTAYEMRISDWSSDVCSSDLRRCQEVVDACWALGAANPILSIHDVGAGGISNALPELVDADGRGGHFQLRDVQAADQIGRASCRERGCQ